MSVDDAFLALRRAKNAVLSAYGRTMWYTSNAIYPVCGARYYVYDYYFMEDWYAEKLHVFRLGNGYFDATSCVVVKIKAHDPGKQVTRALFSVYGRARVYNTLGVDVTLRTWFYDTYIVDGEQYSTFIPGYGVKIPPGTRDLDLRIELMYPYDYNDYFELWVYFGTYRNDTNSLYALRVELRDVVVYILGHDARYDAMFDPDIVRPLT